MCFFFFFFVSGIQKLSRIYVFFFQVGDTPAALQGLVLPGNSRADTCLNLAVRESQTGLTKCNLRKWPTETVQLFEWVLGIKTWHKQYETESCRVLAAKPPKKHTIYEKNNLSIYVRSILYKQKIYIYIHHIITVIPLSTHKKSWHPTSNIQRQKPPLMANRAVPHAASVQVAVSTWRN